MSLVTGEHPPETTGGGSSNKKEVVGVCDSAIINVEKNTRTARLFRKIQKTTAALQYAEPARLPSTVVCLAVLIV